MSSDSLGSLKTPRDRRENQWKAREFSLKQNKITYMSGESRGKERMYISLETTASTAEIDPDNPTWIVLHDDDRRQWKLRVVGTGPAAEDEADGWVTEIVDKTQAQSR